jgi:2-methylcitrate dehydratase PrpD
MGTTTDLAEWVAGTSLQAMPALVTERGLAAIVDTVGVTLAGVGEPVSRIAAELADADGGRPIAARLGTGLRTTPEAAAFVNGIAGHALDYDDVSASQTGHPSVVVLPAALAAAELAGAGGAQLLEAFLLGLEVTVKLGPAIGPEHYRRGWHATSTLGTLGAALAAGKLLGLDPGRLTNAVAIAASMASGSRRNFGTMTKPFHAGHAARCGVHAARLAGAGMTADSTVMEAPFGFFALYSFGAGRSEDLAASLGRPWDLEEVGLSVKKYPCCFAIHRAADGLLDLRKEHSLRGDQVEAVEVVVPVGAVSPLIHDRPQTGLEGKFSMQYGLAAALLDGRLGLDSFDDGAVRRREAQALLPRITVREDPTIATDGANPIESGHIEVAVRLQTGPVLRRRVETPRGGAALPLTREELADKFRDCAAPLLGLDATEAALGRLWALPSEPDVRALSAALSPAMEGAVR